MGVEVARTLGSAISIAIEVYFRDANFVKQKGEPRQPHLRHNIYEDAVGVLDVAVPVLMAVDVRNSELVLLIPSVPPFLFDDVGVEPATWLRLAETDVV